MKISPLAQGTGLPTSSPISAPASDKISRAKAIAAGETPVEASGNQQADRVQQSIKKIKMRTQVSPDRQESSPEVLLEALSVAQETPESPISDPIEETQAAEETKPLSPQFAALAKAKRALQVKERELVQREEALKAQNPAGNEDLIAKLKANPLSVLQEAGVSYDQLTEAILSNQSGNSPELASLKLEIKALKEGLDKQFSERDELAEKQVLTQMKREADLLVADGEQFEAIREAKAQQAVVDLIHRTWKETGEVMEVSEAAELVENQLIDEALPFARIKKIQSRLSPAQEQAQQEQQIQAPKPNTKVMRTLTNRDGARPITDRRARAMAAFNGLLKRG